MKTMMKFAAVGLLLWGGAAHAGCWGGFKSADDRPMYVGDCWPGETTTIGSFPGWAGHGVAFDDFFVVDVNETARLSVVITTPPDRPFAPGPWTLEVYPDAGTICTPICWDPAQWVPGTALLRHEATKRRNKGKVVLPPGRYLVRVAATMHVR